MTNFSKLSFHTNDPERIKKGLADVLGDSAEHKGTLVIIDSEHRQDLTQLLQLTRQYGLQVCAVVDGVLTEQAMVRHIAIVPKEGKIPRLPQAKEPEATLSKTESENSEIGMVVHELVRSGNRLHSAADLLLLQGCNASTEIIADGNISIWGHAQGRIIAGASGNKNAVIVCQNFNADLVAIAGVFIISEDYPNDILGKAVKITLQGDALQFFTL